MTRPFAIYAVFAALTVGACTTKAPSQNGEPYVKGEAPTTAVTMALPPDPAPAAVAAPGPAIATCAPPLASAPSPRPAREGCLIEKGCDDVPPKTLPPCTDDVRAAAVSIGKVVGLPAGTAVTVRGALGAHDPTTRCTMRACRKSCCNHCNRALRLEEKSGDTCAAITINGPFGCGGDESLTCCNGYPLGRTIIATGTLGAPAGDDANISTDALCVE